MCFSAAASFSVGAVTGVIGIAALRQVRAPWQIPLATVPILFAVQQSIEGLLWLELEGAGDGTTVRALSFAYLLFAMVLWPAFTPVAAFLLEPDRRRRFLLGAIAVFGALVSAYLLVDLVAEPVTATIRGNSVAYGVDADPLSWWQLPYMICVCVPLLVSSHRIIRIFGAVVIVGFAVSAYAYTATFVSVWCFFAAADSTLIYLFFRREAAAPSPRRP